LKFGVTIDSVHNWETNRNIPEIKLLPKIYEFLGYCPYYNIYITLVHKKIRHFRESLGLSQGMMAKEAGVNTASLLDWETGKSQPRAESKKRLEAYFSQRFEYPIKLP